LIKRGEADVLGLI